MVLGNKLTHFWEINFLRDTQDSEWRERLGTLERAG